MSLPAGWIALAAFLTLVLGLLLILGGRGIRESRGLGSGKTVSLDRVTLTSHRLGLTGRPDCLIKADGLIIVEEWKSSRQMWPNHRAQMGCYFLLVEEELRIRPSHGFIVCGDGTRHRIDNTEQLRAWVLELAGQIRSARAALAVPIPVNPRPRQCRPCGMRGHCGQARQYAVRRGTPSVLTPVVSYGD
jgi:CRISPR-associated exonuclease Cas4